GEAFDETVPQPLWLVYADAQGAAPDPTATPDTAAPPGAAGADGEVAPELLWERTPSVAPAAGDGAAPSDAAGSGAPPSGAASATSESSDASEGSAGTDAAHADAVVDDPSLRLAYGEKRLGLHTIPLA